MASFYEGPVQRLIDELGRLPGIGPKTALDVLSGTSVASFKAAVVAGDVAALSRIKGIGKKTAERIMVELAGKVTTSAAPIHDETYQALIGLGYSNSQAADAIANLPVDVTDVGERVKLALKGIGR